MAKCDRDCFNCKYSDCIQDNLTSKERKEIKERDRSFSDYGVVVPARRRSRNLLRSRGVA